MLFVVCCLLISNHKGDKGKRPSPDIKLLSLLYYFINHDDKTSAFDPAVSFVLMLSERIKLLLSVGFCGDEWNEAQLKRLLMRKWTETARLIELSDIKSINNWLRESNDFIMSTQTTLFISINPIGRWQSHKRVFWDSRRCGSGSQADDFIWRLLCNCAIKRGLWRAENPG